MYACAFKAEGHFVMSAQKVSVHSEERKRLCLLA
jgi:hypothetical protein